MRASPTLCACLIALACLVATEVAAQFPVGVEDFTGTTFPPAGWTRVNVSGSNQWVRYTSLYHSAPASARISYQSTGGEDWLITPQVSVVTGDSFDFWARRYYTSIYNPDTLEIRVSTSYDPGNPSDLSSFTDLVASYNVNSFGTTTWTHVTEALDTWAGQDVYIAFKHFDSDGNGLLIDDVSLLRTTGAIVVEKQTDPDGAPDSFSFTGDAAGSISDGGQIVISGLLPGIYTSTETVPGGWDLASIVCDDANSSGDVITATATFQLEAGETVTCVFTNTVQQGTVIVEKQTDPDGAPDSFTFTGVTVGNIADGEQIVVSDLLPGTYSSTETVPADWTLNSIVCDDSNSSGDVNTATATFQLEPGETVTCVFNNARMLDFGDAPDSYGTLLASDGARHVTLGGLYLGASVDVDPDGQPTAAADGDDTDGTDDEDGVLFTSALKAGDQGSVFVAASQAGVLSAWIDLDGDGDWDDPGEQVLADRALTAGVDNLSFPVSADAAEGSTFARFRIASVGGLLPTGVAVDGEVEDHPVSIERECDLELVKTDWVDPAVAGLGLRYTLTATNLGPSDASGVTLCDTLPAGVSFLNAVPGSPTCDESGGVVTCVLGDVALGRSSDVVITVLVDPAASGTITNSADGSADEVDPAPGNNVGLEDTAVVVPLFADAFETGDTGAWTLTVPGFALRKLALAEPRDEYWTSFRIDEDLLSSLGPTAEVLLAGVAGNGTFVFVVEAGYEPAGVAVRARARLDDGSWVETEWTAVVGSRGWLEVEWRRAMPELADGHLVVRSNGSAVLSLTGLDNVASAMRAVAVTEKDGRTAVVDLIAP